MPQPTLMQQNFLKRNIIIKFIATLKLFQNNIKRTSLLHSQCSCCSFLVHFCYTRWIRYRKSNSGSRLNILINTWWKCCVLIHINPSLISFIVFFLVQHSLSIWHSELSVYKWKEMARNESSEGKKLCVCVCKDMCTY